MMIDQDDAAVGPEPVTEPEPGVAAGAAPAAADPRDRPRDPVGTRPKHLPEDLLPRTPLGASLFPNGGLPELPPGSMEGSTYGFDGSVLVPVPVGGAGGAGAGAGAAGGSGVAPAVRAAVPAVARATTAAPREVARFQFLTGALVAVGVAVTVLAVYLIAGPAPGKAAPWSSWAPQGTSVDPLTQIAQHVGPEYKLPDGDQIVAVEAQDLAQQGPINILVKQTSGTVLTLQGNLALFEMCGLGQGCAISEGSPSIDRGLLLAREALELSLYAFRYDSGLDDVMVTIPPIPSEVTADQKSVAASGSTQLLPDGNPTDKAFFIQRGQLTTELAHPLAQSLAAAIPSLSKITTSPDIPLVQSFEGSTIYQFAIDNSDLGSQLVLTPPAAATTTTALGSAAATVGGS